MIFKRCAVESNDWGDASAKHKCFNFFENCCSCRVSRATKRLHAERNTRILPRWESTAVCRRICTVHSKLTIAGTSASAIPVGGWFVGPTLIAGRMRLSFSLFAKGNPYSGTREIFYLVQSGIQEVLLAKNRNRIGNPSSTDKKG